MLSRAAETLYWMARYIERAEDITRLLAINFDAQLDTRSEDVREAWLPLVTITGDEATVSLSLLQSGGGVFSDTFRSSQVATTVRQSGTWKIDQMPFPFWSYDWYQPATTPAKPVP